VGNDVWIGENATILSGISIGDGAVVGAGSVVTHDVAPYAIVVGTPARFLRSRFNDATVEALSLIRWWNWSDEKIRASELDFYGRVEEFVAKYDTRKM
jgi:chloramphenicol O-acetyltransferase type B